MRIALIHMRHARTGGTERYLNHLAAHLAERGHDVHILCRRHVEPPHPEVKFRVLRGTALGKSWRMWTFARAVERHVANESYDLVFGLGKTWTHDVMRLGGGLHGTYLRLAHGAKLGPLARRLHAAGALGPRQRTALAIERRALAPRAFKRLVTNSEMVMRDVMRTYGIEASCIETIYNGVDLERFHPRTRSTAGRALRAELGLGDERVVLFLGTGYGRKGLDLVLAAFPELLARHRDARLLVVGFDSTRARYEARARELGIDSETRFLGGRSEVEAVYGAADLYVLPTRYDPFANSTLEALASGLPTITSTTNGAAELIGEGLQGSIVDASAGSDPLAIALLDWFRDDRLVAGRASARALAEQHGIESKLEQTERLLERVAVDGGISGVSKP